MAPTRFACPVCRAIFEPANSLPAGKVIACFQCGTSFPVPNGATAPSPAPLPAEHLPDLSLAYSTDVKPGLARPAAVTVPPRWEQRDDVESDRRHKPVNVMLIVGLSVVVT